MAIKYLDAKRIRGTAAERTALSGSIPQTSWKEIDRVDGNGIQVMDTGTFSTKDNLMLIFNRNGQGSTGRLRFNNDTNTNTYERNFSYNGTTYDNEDNLSGINWYGNDDAGANYSIISLENRSGSEKLLVGTLVEANSAGASNGTNSVEFSGKWIGTAQINRVAVDAGSGNTFPAGTELIVLGYDYSDAGGAGSGTSYWEQIATTTLNSTPSTSGSAASPQISVSWAGNYKYLWVDGYVYGSSDWETSFDEEDDSGDYTWDYVDNSGGYTNIGSSSSAGFHVTGNTGWTAFQAQIVNMSGKEKLYWFNGAHHQASGNASPIWRRVFGKATTTSGQINSIQFWSSNMTVPAPSTITVWGAN